MIHDSHAGMNRIAYCELGQRWKRPRQIRTTVIVLHSTAKVIVAPHVHTEIPIRQGATFERATLLHVVFHAPETSSLRAVSKHLLTCLVVKISHLESDKSMDSLTTKDVRSVQCSDLSFGGKDTRPTSTVCMPYSLQTVSWDLLKRNLTKALLPSA